MGDSARMTPWLDRIASQIGKRREHRHERQAALVEESPLRTLDPRAKLAMSLAASGVVMLPLERLCLFVVLYIGLLAWARLLPVTARQVWRMRWMLLFLFVLDWWLIDLRLAVLVSLRLALLAGTFSLLFATTTFGEFRLAIERLGFPYRFAFSLGLAFQSISLLREEWQAIREAQQARGIVLVRGGLRETLAQIGAWVALTIPAVMLTTRRAWAVTESANARGFDSPNRRSFRRLVMRPFDWLVIGLAFVIPLLFYWRW